MNKKSLVIAVIILLALAGGAFALAQSKKSPNLNGPAANATITNTANNNPGTNDVPQNTNESNNPENLNTIVYTNDGFNTTLLTVKAGSIVNITNKSSRMLQFDSDPHPQHTEDPELNVGNIGPGQSKSITVTKTGSHGYHNHANPDDTGVLRVE
ncbi:MAG TPA: hypothetical protein VM124_01060 [Candidatus Limnocylindrales bacterium]|nr:hypothetical protein [Candidatus Limnocylindrales bacterium]